MGSVVVVVLVGVVTGSVPESPTCSERTRGSTMCLPRASMVSVEEKRRVYTCQVDDDEHVLVQPVHNSRCLLR